MENNNNLNLLSNAELMALTLVKTVNNGNMFLALCLAFYLKDPSIDPDKVRFEEWFTEEKCEEVAAFVREILEEPDDSADEGSQEPEAEYTLPAKIVDWDLENESACRLILQETEKAGTLEACPRCGGRRSGMGLSRYAGINICQSCRKQESKLAAHNKMLPFTEWHFIEFLKEYQKKTA